MGKGKAGVGQRSKEEKAAPALQTSFQPCVVSPSSPNSLPGASKTPPPHLPQETHCPRAPSCKHECESPQLLGTSARGRCLPRSHHQLKSIGPEPSKWPRFKLQLCQVLAVGFLDKLFNLSVPTFLSLKWSLLQICLRVVMHYFMKST